MSYLKFVLLIVIGIAMSGYLSANELENAIIQTLMERNLGKNPGYNMDDWKRHAKKAAWHDMPWGKRKRSF